MWWWGSWLWEVEEINRLQAVQFPTGEAEVQKIQTSDCAKSTPKPGLSPRRRGKGGAPVSPIHPHSSPDIPGARIGLG